LTDAELLNIAEENNRVLRAEKDTLFRRLSVVEAAEYNTRNRYQVLANEHNTCRGRIQGLQERLADERERTEELKREIRLMRRTSHDGGYRERYEAALSDIAERDELIRLEERRVAERDRTIANMTRTIDRRERTIFQMKQCFRELGYRFEE